MFLLWSPLIVEGGKKAKTYYAEQINNIPISAMFCKTPKKAHGRPQIRVNAWTGSYVILECQIQVILTKYI